MAKQAQYKTSKTGKFITEEVKNEVPLQDAKEIGQEVISVVKNDLGQVFEDGKIDINDCKIVGKHILQSRTVWVNVIAIIAFYVQAKIGYAISPDIQTEILGVINIYLRSVTKDPVNWSK